MVCYTPDAGMHRGCYQSWSHNLLFIPHDPMAMDGGDNRCHSKSPPMALRDRIDIRIPLPTGFGVSNRYQPG